MEGYHLLEKHPLEENHINKPSYIVLQLKLIKSYFGEVNDYNEF